MMIMDADKVSSILKKIVLAIFILIIVAGIVFSIFYVRAMIPVDPNAKEEVTFEVEKGWGANKVAEELEKDGIIRSAFIFKIYIKMSGSEGFLAGNYKLSKNMDMETIIEYLTKGNSLENESIRVTFVEGKRFPYYVSKIAEAFNFKEEDIYALTKDPDYLATLIKDYWFITERILDEKLYYPLEGYLFADTYDFKKSSTIEEVIAKMLDQMESKLKVYEEEIKASKYEVHDLLTMASMVELEAVTAEDRLVVAGVFYNRLNIGMSLGSDVTTYYAERKEMTKSLLISEINACNAYNTRGTCSIKGLPVGPICSPSYSSITAAIEPETTKYLYFVADKKNKLYFSLNNSDQLKVIDMLRKQNLWPE